MNFQLSLQKKLLCGICDENFDNDFNNLNSDSCDQSKDLNLSVVFPILNSINILTECNINKGQYFNPNFNNLPLIKDGESLISLGSNTSILSEGDPDFVLSIYLNSQEVFKNHEELNVNNFIDVHRKLKNTRIRNLSSTNNEQSDKNTSSQHASEALNMNYQAPETRN